MFYLKLFLNIIQVILNFGFDILRILITNHYPPFANFGSLLY